MTAERLWDREPSLWEEAKAFQLVRPLSPVFGWEGPSGGAFGNGPRGANGWTFTGEIHLGNPGAPVAPPGPAFTGPVGESVNISNERVQSSLWGTPDRLVLSLGKSDVYNRAGLGVTKGKKPVGQLLLMMEDFAGAAQPHVATTLHNGNNLLRLAKGAATADLQVLLTRRETNVFAIQADLRKLSRPLAVRLYRHRDTLGDLPDPQSGHDGAYFWIHQEFAADKTFPKGFDYYLVATIAGAAGTIAHASLQDGLGAPVPFRKDSVPGVAATASLSPTPDHKLVVYATVVTRAESDDPFAEARKRLEEAETQGFAGLLSLNEAWYRGLYTRRERGRIFTGYFNDARNVVLPFFYHGSFQSRHTYNSNPDPARYEGDANYNVLECDEVFWSGLQCFNEELYTGDFVAGRDETVADYYVKLFDFWRPTWEAHARRAGHPGLYVLRGYVPPVKNDVYWSPDAYALDRCDWEALGATDPEALKWLTPERRTVEACDWACMVWAFKVVWDAYDYGGRDIAFLRESVYPSLRDIADFFASKAVLGDDGYYHVDPSQSRESDVGRDALDCVAAFKWTLKTAVAASELLGVDAAKRPAWRERLDKMTPYHLTVNGKGEPIWASILKNGAPIMSGTASQFAVNVTDEINLESPESTRRLAIRTNRHDYDLPMNRQVEYLLGDARDMLCMGQNPRWVWMFGHSAWLMFYAQKSGAGDFARDLPLQTRAQKTIACWLEPERLCNSRSGTIFFFPCVPSGLDVAFRDFQARGGFLVSGEYRAGTVTCASIKARRDGPCAVMNPWLDQPLRILEQPASIVVGVKQAGERYQFDARAGKSYLLTAQWPAMEVRSR